MTIIAGKNLNTDEDGIKIEPVSFSTPILANNIIPTKITEKKTG